MTRRNESPRFGIWRKKKPKRQTNEEALVKMIYHNILPIPRYAFQPICTDLDIAEVNSIPTKKNVNRQLYLTLKIPGFAP
jgi:hypothetical protein